MADTNDLNALLNGAVEGDPPAESTTNVARKLKRDMARKLVTLNPALKGDGSTEEFLKTAEGLVRREAPAPLKRQELPPARNADELMLASQAAYDQEKRRLESEISILQSKLTTLKPRTLDELMDRLAKLDPNLSSIVTQEALKQRRLYLEQLGFTPAKFIERSRKKP